MEKTPLQEKLELLEVKKTRADELNQQAKDLYVEVNQGWNELSQLIREGGQSTGDQLKDFVIVRYGIFGAEEVEQRFRALQEKIKNHQGQYMMLVQAKEDRIRFSGPGDVRDSDFITRLELDIGVIDAESLILDPPQFFFPTGGKHAICGKPYEESPVGMYEGNLTLHLFEDMGLKTSQELQILVGDQEVIDWFKGQPDSEGYVAVFCEVNYLFGRSVAFPKLTAYLAEERTKVIDGYRSLNARQTWLNLEIKKLEGEHKKSPRLQTGLNSIPEQMSAILERAKKFGLSIEDL